MFNNRKVFIGLVTGALLSAAAPEFVLAAETSGYVMGREGTPVMAPGQGECLKAPRQPKDKMFPECGDVLEKPVVEEKPAVVEEKPEPVRKEIIGVLDQNMVNFAFDKAIITDAGRNVLNNMATYLKNNNEFVEIVEVQGHTDSVGTEAYNQKLGMRRAKAVADYLVSQGVDSAKIKTVSFGETKPMDTNKTKAGRAKNRRAEVHIVINK